MHNAITHRRRRLFTLIHVHYRRRHRARIDHEYSHYNWQSKIVQSYLCPSLCVLYILNVVKLHPMRGQRPQQSPACITIIIGGHFLIDLTRIGRSSSFIRRYLNALRGSAHLRKYTRVAKHRRQGSSPDAINISTSCHYHDSNSCKCDISFWPSAGCLIVTGIA